MQDRAIVFRGHFNRREPGQMQRAPEPIAAPGKMMPLLRRQQAGIDPAEHYGQAFGQDVFKHQLLPCIADTQIGTTARLDIDRSRQ